MKTEVTNGFTRLSVYVLLPQDVAQLLSFDCKDISISTL